jgi:hypothetical protein
MSERKQQQIIWLHPKTNASLHLLFVKSGADTVMAYNSFLAKVLDFFVQDEQCVARFLKQLYSLQPILKEISMYVEKVEKIVEKPVKELVYICFICKEQIPADQMNLFLVKHMEKHLICYKCFAKFTSEAELLNHYKTHQS